MSDYGPPPPPGPGDPQDPGAYHPQPGPYQPYPQPGYGYPPASPARQPGPGLAARLGERLVRRPEPRFAAALAGAGAALALAGTFLWAVVYLFEGIFRSTSSDSFGAPDTDRNWLGAGIFALLAVAGFVAAATQRRGPLATAGVVLGALGVPAVLLFATFDLTSSPGFNIDAITWVSILVWLGAYLVLPGSRGHSFLVFLIATMIYDYVLFKAIEDDFTSVMRRTINGTVNTSSTPGVGTFAVVGLVFGLGYFLIAGVLDARGKHGPATGLIYPAFGATFSGIVASGQDLHVTGAGVLAIIIGAALCWYGGRFGRRVTCFLGAAGAVVGIVAILGDNIDRPVAVGVTMLVIGLIVVGIAAVLASATDEPADMDAEAVVRAR